jgi:hypothetical protein
LAKEKEILVHDQSGTQAEEQIKTESTNGGRKLFVEPEISVPVDVLEATTFFQSVTSGGST